MLTINRVISNFISESKYNQVIMSRNKIKFVIDKECILLNDLKIAYDNYEYITHGGIYYKIIKFTRNIPSYSEPISYIEIELD